MTDVITVLRPGCRVEDVEKKRNCFICDGCITVVNITNTKSAIIQIFAARESGPVNFPVNIIS